MAGISVVMFFSLEPSGMDVVPVKTVGVAGLTRRRRAAGHQEREASATRQAQSFPHLYQYGGEVKWFQALSSGRP